VYQVGKEIKRIKLTVNSQSSFLQEYKIVQVQ